MKILHYLTLMIAALFSLTTFAQYTGPGSDYRNDNNSSEINTSVYPLKTTQDAKRLSNNAYLSMEGYIVRQIRQNYFQFQDNAGSIYVNVANGVAWPAKITGQDFVRVAGRIDKKRLTGNEMVVFKIELLNQNQNNNNYDNRYNNENTQRNDRLQMIERIIQSLPFDR